jgi:hypothetical protein
MLQTTLFAIRLRYPLRLDIILLGRRSRIADVLLMLGNNYVCVLISFIAVFVIKLG